MKKKILVFILTIFIGTQFVIAMDRDGDEPPASESTAWWAAKGIWGGLKWGAKTTYRAGKGLYSLVTADDDASADDSVSEVGGESDESEEPVTIDSPYAIVDPKEPDAVHIDRICRAFGISEEECDRIRNKVKRKLKKTPYSRPHKIMDRKRANQKRITKMIKLRLINQIPPNLTRLDQLNHLIFKLTYNLPSDVCPETTSFFCLDTFQSYAKTERELIRKSEFEVHQIDPEYIKIEGSCTVEWAIRKEEEFKELMTKIKSLDDDCYSTDDEGEDEGDDAADDDDDSKFTMAQIARMLQEETKRRRMAGEE